MAVTVQFEKNGHMEELLLDIVEVANRHTGIRLAAEFMKILEDFGISDKVGLIAICAASIDSLRVRYLL